MNREYIVSAQKPTSTKCHSALPLAAWPPVLGLKLTRLLVSCPEVIDAFAGKSPRGLLTLCLVLPHLGGLPLTLTGRPHVQGPRGPHAGTLAVLSVWTFQPWGSPSVWGGCAHGAVLPSSQVSMASGCRARSSQLWGDGRPSGRRHPPRKTAASPHLRPWHPPAPRGHTGPGPPPASQAGWGGLMDGPGSSFWQHCYLRTHAHVPLARPATLMPSEHRWCSRWVLGLVAAITAVPEAGRGPVPPESSCRPLLGCGCKAGTDVVLWDVSAGTATSELRARKQGALTQPGAALRPRLRAVELGPGALAFRVLPPGLCPSGELCVGLPGEEARSASLGSVESACVSDRARAAAAMRAGSRSPWAPPSP